MKRSREEKIMFGAFQSAGCEVTSDIGKAITDGLRQIRRERNDEYVAKKSAYKEQKRNYYYFCKRKAAKQVTPEQDSVRGCETMEPQNITTTIHIDGVDDAAAKSAQLAEKINEAKRWQANWIR